MKRHVAVAMIAVLPLLAVGLIAEAGDTPSVDEMLEQIHEGGYVVLAEQGEKTHKIANVAQLKALFENDDAIVFFLLEPESGKRHKVGQAQGGEDKSMSWGERIWRFFCCVAGETCCKK